MKINIELFCKLVVSFLLFIARHAQNTRNRKFETSFAIFSNLKICNISKKKGVMGEVDFWYADKHQTSFKLIPLILVGMTRPVQVIQNNKFAKSLQCLKKEVRDEVDFVQWTSLQSDTLIFDGCGQPWLKYWK